MGCGLRTSRYLSLLVNGLHVHQPCSTTSSSFPFSKFLSFGHIALSIELTESKNVGLYLYIVSNNMTAQ